MDFQYLRDFVDCENLSKLASFQPKLLKKGFSESMVKEARSKLKVNKVGRHVFFFFLFFCTVLV